MKKKEYSKFIDVKINRKISKVEIYLKVITVISILVLVTVLAKN